jgi:hypothetical protein
MVSQTAMLILWQPVLGRQLREDETITSSEIVIAEKTFALLRHQFFSNFSFSLNKEQKALLKYLRLFSLG